MELHKNVKKVVLGLAAVQVGVILILTTSRLHGAGMGYTPRAVAGTAGREGYRHREILSPSLRDAQDLSQAGDGSTQSNSISKSQEQTQGGGLAGATRTEGGVNQGNKPGNKSLALGEPQENDLIIKVEEENKDSKSQGSLGNVASQAMNSKDSVSDKGKVETQALIQEINTINNNDIVYGAELGTPGNQGTKNNQANVDSNNEHNVVDVVLKNNKLRTLHNNGGRNNQVDSHLYPAREIAPEAPNIVPRNGQDHKDDSPGAGAGVNGSPPGPAVPQDLTRGMAPTNGPPPGMNIVPKTLTSEPQQSYQQIQNLNPTPENIHKYEGRAPPPKGGPTLPPVPAAPAAGAPGQGAGTGDRAGSQTMTFPQGGAGSDNQAYQGGVGTPAPTIQGGIDIPVLPIEAGVPVADIQGGAAQALTPLPLKLVTPQQKFITTGKPRIMPSDPYLAHLATLEWRCVDDKLGPDNATIKASGLPICPCVPKNLTGKLRPSRWQDISMRLSWERVNVLAGKLHVLPGGYWKPPECFARRRVAIVVPCRDREIHLRTWLAYMHPILQRHNLEYRIFVVEQAWPEIHNKGAMMNIGYLEAKKSWDFDCLMFHDVDLLMEDDRNVYTCWDSPIHFGAYVDKLGYSVIYHIIFGGAVAMRPKIFESVNGYSNNYFGWGGEDDDFSMRMLSNKIYFYRPPIEIARYTSLKHPKDSANPINPRRAKAVNNQPEQYVRDGLNNVKYTVVTKTEFPLYTWIHASLNLTDAVDYPFRTATEYKVEPQGYCLSGIIAMLPLSRISCKYACDTHGDCVSFVYADKVDDDFRCYLKKDVPCKKWVQTSGYVMYSKIIDFDTRWRHVYGVMEGQDCPGKDHASLWATAGQCGRVCDGDMMCVGFTYADTDRGEQRCWLKYQCHPEDRRPGLGVTYRHKQEYIGPGKDYGLQHTYNRRFKARCPDNDIASHFTSLENCAALCDQDERCVAFEYNINVPVPCYTKSVCLPVTNDDERATLFVKETWLEKNNR